ncbi:MAG: hypothetical protein L3K11_08155 [Thermoplasmata archaeon]|nr:hypothetical protein [Thermoplasmata archaeon]
MMLSRGRSTLERELNGSSRPMMTHVRPGSADALRSHSSSLLIALASSPAEAVELGRWPRWLVPGLPREMAGQPSPPNRATPTEHRRV